MNWLIIAIIILLIAAIILAAILLRQRRVPPHKAAGNAGEEAAASAIKRALRDGDQCFRNVPVVYKDRETELDFLIINHNGVFIIEVKNYSGEIQGKEEDRYWEKAKTSQGGNTYVKYIENPIPQIKREESILGHFLRSKRIRVWVYGYVFFIRCNRPFRNEYFINNGNEIDMVIHQETETPLSDKQIQQIIKVLGL